MPPIILAPRRRRGDTIVEVMFAVAIFGAVAIVAIQMMNRGTLTAQAAVEAQQARNEMDAQVSAIKFIHDNFLAEREYREDIRQFQELWDAITSNPRPSAPPYQDGDGCETVMIDPNASQGAFVINTRALQTRTDAAGNPNPPSVYDPNSIVLRHANAAFEVASVYPRLLYLAANPGLGDYASSAVNSVQGLQVFAVESSKKINGQPEYYDFHVRACWRPAGQNRDSKLSTITRALNPRVIE